MSHVCGSRFAFSLDNALRRLVHPPQKILGELVQSGMSAMDVGCGPGHFTLDLARLVGERGKVLAVDLQEGMLAKVQAKARAQGLESRIALHRAAGRVAGVGVGLDFILCFWMLHEVPDAHAMLVDLHGRLKPGGALLLAEPILHVGRKRFEAETGLALMAGFRVAERLDLRWSRAVLLHKELPAEKAPQKRGASGKSAPKGKSAKRISRTKGKSGPARPSSRR